jgi:hypothetical protein
MELAAAAGLSFDLLQEQNKVAEKINAHIIADKLIFFIFIFFDFKI